MQKCLQSLGHSLAISTWTWEIKAYPPPFIQEICQIWLNKQNKCISSQNNPYPENFVLCNLLVRVDKAYLVCYGLKSLLVKAWPLIIHENKTNSHMFLRVSRGVPVYIYFATWVVGGSNPADHALPLNLQNPNNKTNRCIYIVSCLSAGITATGHQPSR